MQTERKHRHNLGLRDGKPSRRRVPAIGFRGDLIRLIISGHKTETRRLVMPQPALDADFEGEANETDSTLERACERGMPGDTLWVKERFRLINGKPEYEASYRGDDFTTPWQPGIAMPFRYSRILLQVEHVVAEPLQQITHQEALAEGVSSVMEFSRLWDELNEYKGRKDFLWDANPWVWVLRFRALTTTNHQGASHG